MAAWGRLALIEAAKQNNTALAHIAEQWGYRAIQQDLFEPQLELPPTPKKQPLKKATKREAGVIKATDAKLPPVNFLAVESVENIQQQESAPEKLIHGEVFNDSDKKHGTYLFEETPLLVSSARYLPLLQNALGSTKRTNKIDTRLLCKKVAQGATLAKIPRLAKHAWPARLLVVMDNAASVEPHWLDYQRVIQALERLLGEAALKVIQFDISSLNGSKPAYSQWPPKENTLLEWGDPFDEVSAVLVLSDLGMASSITSGSIRISPLARWLKKHMPERVKVLNLSPAVASSPFSVLNRRLKTNAFNDSGAVPRHPSLSGFDYKNGNSEGLNNLLVLLSQTPYFDPALMRKIRLKFALGDSYLETLVWNHSNTELFDLGCRVKKEHLKKYHIQFSTLLNPAQQQCFRKLIDNHFSGAYEGLRKLIDLMEVQAASHQGALNNKLELKLQDIEAYFHKVARSGYKQLLSNSESNALSKQCKTVFDYLSEEFRQKKSELAVNVAAVAYAKELKQKPWPSALPENMRAALEFARNSAQNKVLWSINALSANRFTVLKHGPEDETSNNSLIEFRHREGDELKLRSLNENGEKRYEQNLTSEPVLACAPAETFVLNSSEAILRLKAIERPRWAEKMAYRNGKLYAQARHMGEQGIAYWARLNSGSSEPEVSQWDFDWPQLLTGIGKDKYGYYAMLNLTETITEEPQRFRWIPPGRFQMGEDDTLHWVKLTEGVWLGETTVTQALWRHFMGDNPSRFKGEELPVEQVSWHDCQKFISKLRQAYPGLAFRLPTEAEWEYACRAGTTTTFNFGDDINPQLANYSESEKSQTVAAKAFEANAWGLYQMHGNVWEWCNDRYGDYPSAEQRVDPEGLTEAELDKDSADRVLRGGSWNSSGRNLRSAQRSGSVPDRRYYGGVGFRLALGRELRSGGAAKPQVSGPQVAAEQRSSGPETRESILDKVTNIFKRRQ